MFHDLKHMFQFQSNDELRRTYMIQNVEQYKKRNTLNMLIAFIVMALLSIFMSFGMPGGWLLSLAIIGILVANYLYPIDLPVGKILVLVSITTLVMSGLNSMFSSDIDKSGMPFVPKLAVSEIGIVITWFMLFGKEKTLLNSDQFVAETTAGERLFLERDYNRTLFWSMLLQFPLTFFEKTDMKMSDFIIIVISMFIMILVLRVVDGRMLNSIKQNHRENVQAKHEMRERERQQRKRRKYQTMQDNNRD